MLRKQFFIYNYYFSRRSFLWDPPLRETLKTPSPELSPRISRTRLHDPPPGDPWGRPCLESYTRISSTRTCMYWRNLDVRGCAKVVSASLSREVVSPIFFSLFRILRRKLSLAPRRERTISPERESCVLFFRALRYHFCSLFYSSFFPLQRTSPSQAPRISRSSLLSRWSVWVGPAFAQALSLSFFLRPSLPPCELATADCRGATVRAKGATRWRLARGLAYSIRDLLRLRDRPPPPVAPASPQVRATHRGARVRVLSRKRWTGWHNTEKYIKLRA